MLLQHSIAHSLPMSYTPSLQALQSLTQHDLEHVNRLILDSFNQPIPMIHDIAQHIVRSGGKRIRPTLTLACHHVLGYAGQHHIPLATAVELIHTATLLHDDVVDESTLRRGIATANSIWSNQASVLVGDFLFSRAFQLMVASGSMDALQLLANASATIAQGEVHQLMVAGDLHTTPEVYLEVITRKTATLFEAATEIAPILAGYDALRLPFATFGSALGIAFQLVDDALDYAADQAVLGKTVGDDVREGKITLPLMVAYAAANDAERIFWERVISEGNIQDGDVPHAIALVQKHGGIATTLNLAQDYANQAHKALDEIADGLPKQANHHALRALHDTVAFCVHRAM